MIAKAIQFLRVRAENRRMARALRSLRLAVALDEARAAIGLLEASR